VSNRSRSFDTDSPALWRGEGTSKRALGGAFAGEKPATCRRASHPPWSVVAAAPRTASCWQYAKEERNLTNETNILLSEPMARGSSRLGRHARR